MWRAGLLPGTLAWWLLMPLLASAYGFCQVAAKTDDGYFLGFPSLWNIVAFYLYVLHPPGEVSLTVLIVLGLLTFVPSRYLYPTQPGLLNKLSALLGAVWTCLLAWILWRLPSDGPTGGAPVDAFTWRLAVASLFYPIYYMVASWAVTLWLR